jgi:hypothetical protein
MHMRAKPSRNMHDTCTHACINIILHTYIHTYISYVHTYRSCCVRKDVHTPIHIHRTYKHVHHAYIYTRTYTRTIIHKYTIHIRNYRCVNIHPRIQKCTRTSARQETELTGANKNLNDSRFLKPREALRKVRGRVRLAEHVYARLSVAGVVHGVRVHHGPLILGEEQNAFLALRLARARVR